MFMLSPFSSKLTFQKKFCFQMLSVDDKCQLQQGKKFEMNLGTWTYRNFKYGPRCKKTCLWWLESNKATDQPAHTCSLISASEICLLESIISRLAMTKIAIF